MSIGKEPTAIDIKYSYVNTFLAELTAQYQEIEKQCYEFLAKADDGRPTSGMPTSDMQSNDSPPDFVKTAKKIKIPVWVLWWQGEKNAPEIVRICIESMRKNFPADLAEIHLLTAENIGNYVSFPEYIVEKYNRGIISLTHLSDIIRAELLSEHGGMWIDATYFVAGIVPEDIFNTDEIWTQKFEHPLWTADVVQGRWSINLMKGQAHELLFDFWRDALLFYWQRHDRVIDYYLTDYIIAVAYENLRSVREELENCNCSNPELFALREIINAPFEKEKWKKLCRETQFFKLSYKVDYVETIEDNTKTFYGHMKNMSSERIGESQ